MLMVIYEERKSYWNIIIEKNSEVNIFDLLNNRNSNIEKTYN